MKILRPLIGKRFISLLKDGRIANKSIKTGPIELLEKCSSEPARYLPSPLNPQSIPNPIALGIICLILGGVYTIGIQIILFAFKISIFQNVAITFSSLLIIAIMLGPAPWCIGRGNIWGLYIFLILYLVDIIIVLTCVLIFTLNLFLHNVCLQEITPSILLIILTWLCQKTLNSNLFINFVSYCRIRHLSLEVCNKRKIKH